MDKPGDETTPDSAEKAYAAAAEGVVAKVDGDSVAPAPVAFPPKAKRAPSTPDEASPVAVPSEPAADVSAVSLPAELEADLATAKIKKVPVKKPAATRAKAPAVPAKKATAKKSAPKKTAKLAKPAVTAPTTKPTVKPAAPAKLAVKRAKPVFKTTTITQSKEPKMPAKKKTDYTKDLKTLVADAQTKAKLALAKGSAILSEASTFTKGNVDAVVESGKILATGLQGMGKDYVAEGKAAYETLTADVKELTKVKSPTEFVGLQTKIVRRNVDHAFSLGSKNTEAMFKLLSDVAAPISARATLAVEKFKKAA